MLPNIMSDDGYSTSEHEPPEFIITNMGTEIWLLFSTDLGIQTARFRGAPGGFAAPRFSWRFLGSDIPGLTLLKVFSLNNRYPWWF
jgi:hypothetical protein